MTDSYPGMPGVGDAQTASHRQVVAADPKYLPGGLVVSGENSRDPDNAPDSSILRAGMLLGERSSDGKYAPTIVGLLSEDALSGTSLTVTAAEAAEIDRRIGSGGSVQVVGPATSGDTAAVNIDAGVISTVSGSTVVLTTSLANAKLAGSYLTAADGSGTAKALVGDGFGYKVTDAAGNDMDVALPRPLIGGFVSTSSIVGYRDLSTPARGQVKSDLNSTGQFMFDDDF